MRTTSNGFRQRLTITTKTNQRPFSAHFFVITPKCINQQYCSLRDTKKSVSHTIQSNNMKIRWSQREYSKSPSHHGAKSAINLSTSSKKKAEYRFQVINSHCMKKIAIEAPLLSVSMLQHQKNVLGEGITEQRKISKKEFIGKRLKALKAAHRRHLKTEPDQGDVAVAGVKIF